MFKDLFWFQINSMSHSVETKTQVIILMVKDKTPIIIIRESQLFYICEVVHKHNCRTWAAKNPFIAINAAVNSPKVNTWCAMSNK